MPRFVDREQELDTLHRLYAQDAPSLAIVYGRRRMGKTTLVIESIRDRTDAIYYQATRGTAAQQLAEFREAAAGVVPDITRLREEWEPNLIHLVERDAIVVIDEFPYLVEQADALPSILQRIWDHHTDGSTATFVLTGSAIGMMHDYALDGAGPLYGRVAKDPNGAIEVGPLPFAAAMAFFPEFPAEEQVMAYGVFGGTPEYLQAIRDTQSLADNVTRTLLDRGGSLHEEPENVLHRELDDVNRYFAVLKSMAAGNRARNEIAQGAGINADAVGYYLDRLKDLKVVDRHYPVTVDPARSRKGRYRITDPLFRFWFRFIYGRGARYEVYGEDAFEDLIEPELPDFVSGTFEELCQRAILYEYGDAYRFAAEPGQWWDNGHEIDIVAPTTGDTLVVGEAKFQRSALGYGVIKRLEEEAAMIDWRPDSGDDPEFEYAVFSRSGFSPAVEEAASQRDNVQLFTVEDVVDRLTMG